MAPEDGTRVSCSNDITMIEINPKQNNSNTRRKSQSNEQPEDGFLILQCTLAVAS